MNPEDFHADEDDEYLTRVVIDTCARTFYMYSNEGGKRKIICDKIVVNGISFKPICNI